MKQVESTERTPLNDARHYKFLVGPGTINTSTNELNRKFQEEFRGIFSEKCKYREFEHCFKFKGETSQKMKALF